MYRIIKSSGNANVIVENTDTKANIIIGRANMEIINTLKEAGYEVPAYSEEWDIEVNNDVAKALALMAMKMKKPIRDQSKKYKPATEKIGAEVDAFDLIYGIS